MRYMIPEYKHSEYGKIFGNLMDLSEATAHSIHPIGHMGDIRSLFLYKLENKEE